MPDDVTVISKDMSDDDVFSLWKVIKEGLDKGLSGVVSGYVQKLSFLIGRIKVDF